GDPFEFFYLGPSITQGPLPVGLFCPGDPRLILVGTELQSLATLNLLSPTGAGAANYPVPNDPAFQGLPFFAQAMTLGLGGAPCLVDDLSSQNAYKLAAHDTTHNTVGNCVTPRQGHTLSVLNDGTVLVAGGDEPTVGGVLIPRDTIEIYDPQTQRFTQLTATMAMTRSAHTATNLADGRILIVGGYDALSNVTSAAEIFDPATGTSSAVASMSVARTQHTATLMADGRVLVTGGSSKFDLLDLLGSLAQVHDSAEIYDPATDTWTSTPGIPGVDDGVAGHAASLLGNGQVLVTAGAKVSIVFGIPIPSMTNGARRYDPPSNSWVSTASLPGTRVYHAQVTLADGTALIGGGADGDFVALNFFTVATCARYNSSTNSWTSVASLSSARAYLNMVLANGEVVVIGGLATVDISTGSGTPSQDIEVSSGSFLSWTTTAATALPRDVARAAVTEGGDRVVFIGSGDNGVPAVVDTTDDRAVADWAKRTLAKHGAPDLLINNAAAAIYQPLTDYPLQRRRLMVEVNLQAP
ncbi:MAG: hypothetical protein HRU14_18430, partial [Planctomycetes bacterium]|nr:hypothetical protein [Planctomycetota bacterium]